MSVHQGLQRRSRVFVRALVSALLLIGSWLVVPATPARAAGFALVAPSPKPIAGEKFVITGLLPTAVARPVTLQKYASKKWKAVTSGTSAADGSLALTTATKATTKYRVVAKKATVDLVTYPQLVSASLTVKLASQKASLRLSATTVYRDEPVVATMTFSPVREGWPVQLQVKSGSSWKAAGAATAEDADGTATATVPTTATGTKTYRAVKLAGKGVAARASASVALVAKAPKLTGVSVGTGWANSCVVTKAGGLQCWGNNEMGQLGNKNTTSQNKPVQVFGMTSGVASVGSGRDHTCARTTSGTVWCWGVQKANGLPGNTGAPVELTALGSSVRQLGVGEWASCAVVGDRSVYCWGSGPLGDGTDISAEPVGVAGLAAASQVSVGNHHACAVDTSGAAFCWGTNDFGELGDGSKTSSATPVAVAGLAGKATAISAGGTFTCALLDNGEVQCWGFGSYGQLGNGTWTQSSTPVTVSLPGAASTIDAGGVFACAVVTGTAWCWGANGDRELGVGGSASRAHPLAVPVKDVASVSAGGTGESGGHACAVLYSGGVTCWGWGYHGQLGNGKFLTDDPYDSAPVGVIGFT